MSPYITIGSLDHTPSLLKYVGILVKTINQDISSWADAIGLVHQILKDLGQVLKETGAHVVLDDFEGCRLHHGRACATEQRRYSRLSLGVWECSPGNATALSRFSDV